MEDDYVIFGEFVLSGSLVTIVWRFLRLRMVETASSYGK
jgi:hypothetical protein